MALRAPIAAVLFAAAALTLAQAQPPAMPSSGPAQAFTTLTDQPATHSGFTFDRAMLQIAQNLLASNGVDPKHASAALTAVTFDNYRYSHPVFYSPEAMQHVIEDFRAAGWRHLVNANQTPASTAQPTHMVTDLWLHFAGSDIDGVTVLTRSGHDMNVVQVAGDLRPLDLLRLSGHFGIPHIDPNAVMVPAPPGH